MFVQSHIQRNHRQNSNNIKAQAQNQQQQQHQYPSNSVRSASVGNSGQRQPKQAINNQTTRGKNLSNRRISRDFSFDIPNDHLCSADSNYNWSDNTSNSVININSERHRADCSTLDSNNNLESYYNYLPEVDTNDAFEKENEENSILVQLNDSFKLERCRLRSVDSFADSHSLTPKFNQSFQVADDNYDHDLPLRTNYKELDYSSETEEFEKCVAGVFTKDPYFEANIGAHNELDREQDAMIVNSNSDDDDYQDISLKIETIGETEGCKLSTDVGSEPNQTLIKKIINTGERSENSLTGRRQQQFISRSSIISCSKKNFELVSSFCRNFITYQLETWRLLAGIATNCGPQIISSPISEISPQRSICSICHIVQTNVPKPPPRGKVFDSEEVKLELIDDSSNCNNNLLPEEIRLSTSKSQLVEQTREEEQARITMIDRTNYSPYVVPRPILHRAFTSDSHRISPNVNHLIRPNNAYLHRYTGNHFDTSNVRLLDYQQHDFSQRTQTPVRYANQQVDYGSNSINERPSSLEKQNLVMRGGGSIRHTPTRFPHLYRASTGIELRNESTSREQEDNFFSQNQQLHDYGHHHRHRHDHHHHNHHHNHRQCQHRKLIENYQQRTRTADFPLSPSESFDLSLDEKYPIPPPVSDTWTNPIRPHNNHNFNQQQAVGETTKSIKADWSQHMSNTRTRQNFDTIRSTTLSSRPNREYERDLGRREEKRVSENNKKKTGSDSELCSIKREQVSQEAEASIRQASTSKPSSIEKINDDVNQFEKLNCNLSAKDDLRTVSPNSVDSGKLLTVGFSRFSKRISPNKLGLAGARRRLWLKQKGLNSLSVQRSEEVTPVDTHHLVRQMTTNSLSDSGTESVSWISRSHIVCDPRARFVEGLGQGQIASRQALVSPYLGDIQISLSDQRGMLEVEVVRARRLHAKPGANILPSPFVKVYLMKEKKCIAKFKTNAMPHTLDPLYQEKFIFRYNYENCVLQVIVWGDYGRKDRKSLMGISQIQLGGLEISKLIIDWYQLFNAPSMASSFVSSKALRQTMLMKEESR